MKNTYSEMKDSGVAWIGNTPTTWDTKHLFQLTIQVKNKNSTLLEQNLLSLSYGKIKRKSIETKEGLLPASFDNYNIVEKDDIVLRLTDLQNDHTSLRVGKVEERGIITSAYVSIRPVWGDSKYIYYALHSFDLKKGFYGMGAGVRQGLTFTEAKMIKIPFPGLTEQTAIAAYLDEKCGTIDAIIEEAKASIEEYKAWKSSVIFEAVTKGLNPNAEMKDSGVEWIGKVPKHWDVVSLKRFYDYTHGAAVRVGPFGSTLASGDIIADGIWVYNQRTVLDNNFMSNDTCVSEEKAKQLSSFRVYPGDILITTRGSIGKIAIVPSYAPPGLLHPCIIRFLVNENRLNKNLLRYIFNDTDMVKKQILYYSNSTTIDVLYSYTLKEIKIPLIPLDEQQQIIDFLDKKCAAIDGIIAEKEALIADMEAYKKSLIFETVTGKRKVY